MKCFIGGREEKAGDGREDSRRESEENRRGAEKIGEYFFFCGSFRWFFL